MTTMCWVGREMTENSTCVTVREAVGRFELMTPLLWFDESGSARSSALTVQVRMLSEA